MEAQRAELSGVSPATFSTTITKKNDNNNQNQRQQ